MHVELLPSAIGTDDSVQHAMTYLVNDVLAVDAGSLGYQSSLERQRGVRRLFLTHSHQDHLASLPLWLDNIFASDQTPPEVFASVATWKAIKAHYFNDVIWPDLNRLAEEAGPFYSERVITSGETVSADGLSVTACALDHTVPVLGYLIDDGVTALGLVSDTRPTVGIWELLRNSPRLRGVIIEASFPNRLAWLAERSGHLTPDMAAAELAKLGREVPTYFVHLKPQTRLEVAAEIRAFQKPHWRLLRPGEMVKIPC